MKRARAIIRVSQKRDRDGDSFISPGDQRKRIQGICERERIALTGIAEEIDVSGGTPLAKRTGLLSQVEAIEAGEAEVLVVGYFDRLVRSLRVQEEIVSRVEAARGEVLTVDYGRVSEETAAEWLKGTFVGAMHEYYRRQAKERGAEAQADAVARGIPPFPHIPPGYQREVIGTNRRGRPVYAGPFLPDPATAPVLQEAFEMRAASTPWREIRDFLRANGIERSHHSVASMMSNRIYLGELRFGELVNLQAHELIIPRHLFDRVQRTKTSGGRRAKSDRLLARLGVLRCGSCGARMIVSVQTQGERRYPYYRCQPTGDCGRRMTIAAPIVEQLVEDAVKEALADVEGRASVEDHARDAEETLERVQADLSAAIRAFAGVADEDATQERLGELRAARDDAQEVVDQLRGSSSAVTLTGADWGLLTLSEKRDLIRAVVEEVTVSPGRGAERISIKLFV